MDDKEYDLILKVLELEIAYYKSLKGGPGSGRKPAGRKPRESKPKEIHTIRRDKPLTDLRQTLDLVNGKESTQAFKEISKNPEAVQSIKDWTQSGYQYVRAIQQGKDLSSPYKEQGEKILKGLDNNFSSLPKYEGPLTRDIDIDPHVFEVGKTFTTDAYTSFTAKDRYASARDVRIVVENNTAGRAIWGLSGIKAEAEVLVPKDTTYKVTKIEPTNTALPVALRDPTIVYVKEVKSSKSVNYLNELVNTALDLPLFKPESDQ